MLGREIRESFLKYFERHGHTRVKSSALVPQNDPTLLFTNAGMVQFKDVFTGVEKRGYSRATSSQKCVRAGGKHNDLENVGHTARHHTFFEMLGNFSFGDYFKKDAIAFAWEWVTRELKIPAGRLCVTIFEGEGEIPPDLEAEGIWKAQGVPAEKILRFGKKDNFWAMGDTGPCGPCSEIHFHQGDVIPCAEEAVGRKCLGPGCDCDRWVEIWNLVFMQFERKADGSLIPLPRPSIDTGAGLERIAAIMQGKLNNYDSDLFAGLLAEGARIAGVRYGSSPETDISLRIMADHARATAFLVADGVIPSNEGRGYVLRRIMRRAVRNGYKIGVKDLFLERLCNVVIEEMGGLYTELKQHSALIGKVAQSEEEGFRQTLREGLRLLDEEFERMAGAGSRTVSGEATFKLHDTFGFPTDLTASIASERGFIVDMDGYERLMEEQRHRAEWKGSGEEELLPLYKELRSELGPTEFLGYTAESVSSSRLLAMVGREGGEGGHLKRKQSAGAGEQIEVVLSRTPFYGRSGGQEGDHGVLMAKGGAIVEVHDSVKHFGDFIVHMAKVVEGTVKAGEIVEAHVSGPRRSRVKAAHSATHLLQAALRKALGEHVKQAGSFVDEDFLRFDFHHFSQVTQEQIAAVEDEVNARVRDNIERVYHVDIPMDEAVKQGAMALFGEKYGDHVRMVEIGDSKELCGGTHVERTGDIGLFKVSSEGSVAAGIRRIEAFTGGKAESHVRSGESVLRAAAQRLKCAATEVDAKVEAQHEKIRELERAIEGLKDKISAAESKKAAEGAVCVNGVSAIAATIENADPAMLRNHADRLKEQIKSGVVLVGTVRDGKASFVCGVTADLTKRFNAGKIVKELAAIVGGSGGGRADMAQAGGPEVGKVQEAVKRFYAIVEEQATSEK
jgi:alanyl-tRNA synthetase